MKAVLLKRNPRSQLITFVVRDQEVEMFLLRCALVGCVGQTSRKSPVHMGCHLSGSGHEPAGEISYVGEEVDGFSTGDRVFVHHHVGCYSCSYCLHGDYTMCGMYQKSNIDPCGLS